MKNIYEVAWDMLYDEEDEDWIDENIKSDEDALNHVIEFEGEEARRFFIENGVSASECTKHGIL